MLRSTLPAASAVSPGTTRTALPHPVTATTRAAVADAVAGLSGVMRDVHRDAEPEVPDAVDSALA